MIIALVYRGTVICYKTFMHAYTYTSYHNFVTKSLLTTFAHVTVLLDNKIVITIISGFVSVLLDKFG